jgi:transcriptional regulator with XRE-family HTH domain
MMQDEFKDNYLKIGLKVSYYRKLKGFTQEQLAERMSVATSFIGQIEAPNIHKPISLDTLFRIAKALEVPPHKFLDFE